MTSTSFITVAGLKKCMPTTFSGRPVTMATSMIGYDDVLVAMMASGPRMPSSSVKISFFRSRFSGAASMTYSHGARSAMSVVQVMLATAASRAASSSFPRSTAFAIDPSTLP